MRSANHQSGFAMLLILLVVVAVGASLLMAAQLRGRADTEVAAEASRDLRMGTSALLVYAALGGVTSGRPGTVPCPDMSDPDDDDNYGRMNIGNCSGGDDVYAGRLPWKTLDTEPAPEPVWLAIDRRFVNHPASEPVNPANPDLTGALELNGGPGYAAIVLVPGPPLAGQTGRPSANIQDYLEGHNIDGHDTEDGLSPLFESCGGAGGHSRLDDSACNDRALGIRADRVLEMGGRRALAHVETMLRAYYDQPGPSRLPHAAAPGTAPELPCEDDRLTGRLPLTAGDPGGGGCGGNEFLDVCEMDIWIRPLDDDMDAFDCEDEDGGNDWLQYVTYEIDPGCTSPGGNCSARLAFVDDFDDIEGYSGLIREFVLSGSGEAE